MKRIVLVTALLLMAVMATAIDAYASADCRVEAVNFRKLIYAGQFKEAEPSVRDCLERHPEDLGFLSSLDVVLNGQGRYDDADKVRDQILEIWKRDYKAKWIENGSPVGESSWARMVMQSKDYHVIGTEYYTPEPLGEKKPPMIVSFYKLLAFPEAEGGKTRLFKLEMSDIIGKYYVLRESFGDGGGAQRIPYGDEKPELRRVVKEAVSFLDSEKD